VYAFLLTTVTNHTNFLVQKMIKRVYLPNVLQGNTVVLRDGPYALSLCASKKTGCLYVDKSIFYATGLPLFQTVEWKIDGNYIDFFKK